MHWLGHSVLQSEKNDDLQILILFMGHTWKCFAKRIYILFENLLNMVPNRWKISKIRIARR